MERRLSRIGGTAPAFSEVLRAYRRAVAADGTALAEGLISPDQAYEDAGFVPGHHHASPLSMRREIAERIGEIRVQLTHLDEARTHGVISALRRAAKASEATATAAALKEIRLTLLEAHPLHEDLEVHRKMDRSGVIRAEKF